MCKVELNETKGGELMVDVRTLKTEIVNSGMTMTAIARKSGIVRETLYNRLNGVGEFTASEIEGLSNALNLTIGQRNNIFFASKVE